MSHLPTLIGKTITSVAEGDDDSIRIVFTDGTAVTFEPLPGVGGVESGIDYSIEERP